MLEKTVLAKTVLAGTRPEVSQDNMSEEEKKEIFDTVIQEAVGDGTRINTAALEKIRLKYPDLYTGFLKEQAEKVGKQIEVAVREGASVDEELKVRNWAADYFSALGANVMRRTREDIAKQRVDEKKPVEDDAPEKDSIGEINERAGSIEAAEALDIMNQVYRAGKFIPGALASTHMKQEISSEEELALVRRWLAMPSIGKTLTVD